MRCFNHREQDAVGTCKHCHKGICIDCAADLGSGLACRHLHETQVTAIGSLIDRNVQANRLAPTAWYVGPAFSAFMGSLFVGYGLVFLRKPSYFLILLGAGFIVFSAIAFAINYRVIRSSTKP